MTTSIRSLSINIIGDTFNEKLVNYPKEMIGFYLGIYFRIALYRISILQSILESISIFGLFFNLFNKIAGPRPVFSSETDQFIFKLYELQ